MKRKKIREIILTVLLLLPALLICLPIVLLVTGSVMDEYELYGYLSPVFGAGEGYISWKIIPDYPTFANYGRLLFRTPQFFVLFWNSVKLVVLILSGQLLIGIPAAWAFAAYKRRGSSRLFSLYVVLMLMPFQVTMLSSYIVMNKLSLMNTHEAIILPAVFSTFPIFLVYNGFRNIPGELLDAARVDGAGELRILLKVGLPLGRNGILSALVLGFLEYWNLMEQPMAFLQDKALWPLSLYLPEISWNQAGFAFCACLITLIPAVLVFLLGQEYLEQGIVYSGFK